MARSFLITGTDTGVGKTTVASALAAALSIRGLQVAVSKPVETGCELGADGHRLPADAAQLRWAAGSDDLLERICPWRLREPLAPSIAARREGVRLELAEVASAVRSVASGRDVALIEGAGGLLVPLAEAATFADLARACGLRLIVVVGNRLGALNHARLTLAWASDHGLDVAGYIINALAEAPDLAAETNVAVLGELLGPALGVFPYMGAIGRTATDRQRLAGAAERSLDLASLLG